MGVWGALKGMESMKCPNFIKASQMGHFVSFCDDFSLVCILINQY